MPKGSQVKYRLASKIVSSLSQFVFTDTKSLSICNECLNRLDTIYFCSSNIFIYLEYIYIYIYIYITGSFDNLGRVLCKVYQEDQ